MGKKRRLSLSKAARAAKNIVWRYRGRLAIGLALLLVGRLAGMVLPASTKYLIDEVLGNGRRELLLWIAVAAGIGSLVQAASSYALSLLLGAAAQRSIHDLRLRVQRHVGRLPVSYFEEHKTGELISRVMQDAEGVRNLVGTGFVQLVGGSITAIVSFGVLLWINWRLTLITLLFLGAFSVVMVIGFTRLRPIFRQRNQINAEISGRLAESLGGVRVVKAYTAEEHEEQAFAAGAEKLLGLVIRSVVGVSTMGVAARLLFSFLGLAMILLGAREIFAGTMTIGDLATFAVFTGMMVTPLIQMSSIATQVTEAFAGLDRIHEIMSLSTEDEDDAERVPTGRVNGEVEFDNVSFEYKAGEPVLRQVSFNAPAGTTTALVGSSGAGKTTLIHLVLAFRRPTDGRVLVDGQDLASLRLREYRSQVGVVLQDDFLFAGTIAENIAYGAPGADREELLAAAALAHCDEFVSQFEDGYDTVIGERGVKLSGGQRQRVTIARAILADPRILILDEATSSLDSESEQYIQEGLATLRRGRTTFVIAHRLSTIRNADQILVLEEGEIVERGRHEELVTAGGRYQTLYEKQYRIAADQFINPGEDPSTAFGEEEEPIPASRPLAPGRLPRD